MGPLAETVRLVRAAGGDVRRAWTPLVLFAVGFKALEAWLLLPAVAVALSAVMARGGRVAVSDWDILDFLLTPAGLAYAGLFGAAAVGLLLVEQAGVMLVVARSVAGRPARLTPLAVAAVVWRVTRLGAVLLGRLAVAAVPFAALLALTYAVLLSGQDINYYLAVRPPAFWQAVGVGGSIGLAAAAVGLALLVRWALALPVLLFEPVSVRAALRASRERVRGAGLWVGLVLAGWHLGTLLLAVALHAGFRLLASRLPAGAADSPWWMAVLLVVQGAGVAGVSVAGVVGQAVLLRRLYLSRSEPLGPPAGDPAAPVPSRARPAAVLAVAALLGGPVVAWVGLAQGLDVKRTVRVTAHRGHAKVAPENTPSALRAAVASGADYAEVDVQLTADGVAVLLHDRDLKRVTGDPRRLADVSLAELRTLDAGSWFGPGFAGERVPTLAEAIELARGRIRLNLELKLYGPDAGLAREVARVVEAAGFEGECVVTSFSLPALAELRARNPRVRTGPIVAAALGDVTRLDGEVLSVRADLLTDSLLRQAHRHGREVHVWTVNDERQMLGLVKRGADNILTSDPDVLVRVRDRWAALTDVERLVLASRVLLGLD